jgi:ribosomal protein S15P/S13E
MMDKCFDEGTIQAFLDGELGPGMIDKVTSHIALCDECALAIAEAEQESAYAFAALEKEFDTLVPTQRLWSKINDSIEIEANKRSIWQTLSEYLTSPMAAVCASLVIAFGLFAGIINFIDSQTGEFVQLEPVGMDVYEPFPDVVFVEPTPPAPSDVNESVGDNEKSDSPVPVKNTPVNNKKYRVVNASYNSKRNGRRGNGKVNRIKTEPKLQPSNEVDNSQFATEVAYLPGEETYLRTITTLEEKVNQGKDYVLNPSARFSYEKDLAVATDAINKMREEVKKNPKNSAAREVLRTAYQNKIDLLSAVSEKTELLASLD